MKRIYLIIYRYRPKWAIIECAVFLDGEFRPQPNCRPMVFGGLIADEYRGWFWRFNPFTIKCQATAMEAYTF